MIFTSYVQMSNFSIALCTTGGAPDGSLNFSLTETIAKAVVSRPVDQGEGLRR